MARKYLSSRTRTKHTYEFYKERRDNPQWHADFIQVRTKRRQEIAIQVIIVLIILIGGSFVFTKSRHSHNVIDNKVAQSSSVSVKETSSEIVNSENNVSSSERGEQKDVDSESTVNSDDGGSPNHEDESDSALEDSKKNVQKAIGEGFEIVPILYNGEDTNQAMTENKAPQNLVHDNFMIGYLKDDTVARVSSMNAAYNQDYKITNGALTIGQHRFKYRINDDQVVSFENEKQSYQDGSTVTWQLSKTQDARQTVDSRPTQN